MAWRRRMGGLIVWDFALSFMWAWAGSLTKLFVYSFLDWGRTPAAAEAMKLSISVLYMYFFAWMGNLSRGGAYNPLTVLSSAFMGGLDGFLFNLFGRIPAQVSKYHLSRIWVWIWNSVWTVEFLKKVGSLSVQMLSFGASWLILVDWKQQHFCQ